MKGSQGRREGESEGGREWESNEGRKEKKAEKQQHIFYAAVFFFLQKESKWTFISIAAHGTFLSVDPINFNTQVLTSTSKLPSHFWSLLVP